MVQFPIYPEVALRIVHGYPSVINAGIVVGMHPKTVSETQTGVSLKNSLGIILGIRTDVSLKTDFWEIVILRTSFEVISDGHFVSHDFFFSSRSSDECLLVSLIHVVQE